MTSKCPSRPMAARRVWACTHVLRALAGEEIPVHNVKYWRTVWGFIEAIELSYHVSSSRLEDRR